MAAVAAAGRGVVVLIGQENAAETTLDEIDAFPATATVTGVDRGAGRQNYRVIGTGSQILRRLGVGRMKLMSSPIHFNALSGFNLEITEFVQAAE
jgi:3,4-dihydroxy 2-butanone 4-phosphate synthase/GTP cyclohydrolase II